MTDADAELARIALIALGSLEERSSGSYSLGVIRRALRRFESITEKPFEEPASDGCENCDAELIQPATGRRRRYCPEPACQAASRRGGKTREKATIGA